MPYTNPHDPTIWERLIGYLIRLLDRRPAQLQHAGGLARIECAAPASGDHQVASRRAGRIATCGRCAGCRA